MNLIVIWNIHLTFARVGNLGNLNSAFRASDFRPTDQDIKVKDELIKKVKIQLDKYNSIISNDIPNFNSSFKNLELDYLNVFM